MLQGRQLGCFRSELHFKKSMTASSIYNVLDPLEVLFKKKTALKAVFFCFEDCFETRFLHVEQVCLFARLENCESINIVLQDGL